MADYDLQYQDTHIDALLATANELKTAGYIYKGVATPSTNPGTPTDRVAYLASEPGTYTNFGGIVIASGLYSLTYAGGTWTGTQMQVGSGSASNVAYDNSQSGLAAEDVQEGLDELSQDVAEIKDDFSHEMQMYLVNSVAILGRATGYIDTPLNLEPSAKYRFHFELTDTTSQNIGFYLRESASHSSELTPLGAIKSGDGSADIFFETDENNAKQYLSWWSDATVKHYCKIAIYRIKDIDLDEVYSEVFVDKYDHTFILGGISHGVDNNNAIAIKTDYISINQELRVNLSTAQGIPSAYSQWLVFYKDGIFVRSEELAISPWITISPSNDYNQVRIQLVRRSECTESQASNSHAFITPSSKISRIDNIEQEVDDLKNSGGLSPISISASDLGIDLTNEVLDLSNVSATNYKYNGTSAVTNNNWRLINNVLPAKAGVYYVVDNNGNMIKSQIAYVNNNGDILRVHGTDSGSSNNMISNYYIDTLEATGLRIAVNATSLSGLHITNGRKFIITDNAKRAAFDMLCSDGRINVGFIEAATASERITLGLKMAGDFGVVYIPSGRYEITSCIWAGVGAQSIEMESDTFLVASDSFTGAYLIEWSYNAIDTNDPEWANTFGESSSLVAAHITGGLFDARGKGGCLRVYSFRGFEIHSCHFYNSSTKAVSVEKPGFELVMHDCSARNDIKGLANNIGFNLVCNDCHYHDLICVNYKYAFKVSENAMLERCHPWLGRLDQTTYYDGSIGFDLGSSRGAVLVNCYSDGMQTHYKTGKGTKLIGCICLSAVTAHWDPRPYGNIYIVNNKYSDVVLIGCNYLTSGGAVLTKNAGSVDVQEIGCTAF